MVIYLHLHGFNSSPASHKAQALGRYMAARGLGDAFFCPALPPSGIEAMAIVEKEVARRGLDNRRVAGDVSFVGSSLGGYYATWLAEQYTARAVLINPAVSPGGVRSAIKLGPQQNMYTGERYELTQAHIEEWKRLWRESIDPSRYLLMVETGDEVLDYRVAVERYRGSEQIVVEGGDHSFQSFEQYIPRLLEFAGFKPAIAGTAAGMAAR